MVDQLTKLSLKCLRLILRPIAKFCLDRAISIQDLMESVKFALVAVAQEELERRGEKSNVSKLSVMTGLHRRDVMRILENPTISDEPSGLTSRIVGQWEQDKRFTTKAGVPRGLTCEADDSEFAKLVKHVSKDLHPSTLLRELERLGIIEVAGGVAKIKQRHESVHGDPDKSYQLLANDVTDLITATEENVFARGDTPNLHARTEYDNVFVEDLPKVRDWLLKEGSAFHQRARTFIAKYDKDINPHIKKDGGAKVVVGTFSRTLSEALPGVQEGKKDAK